MVGFRQLKVWERSHQLTLAIYRVTRTFPVDEKYGISSQLRRSASSVSANIAEGCGRRGKRDFARFLSIALGSASELEYHLLLAFDLGLVEAGEYGQLESNVTEAKRMLTGLIRKLSLTSDV
jgi:four helix bundle protein